MPAKPSISDSTRSAAARLWEQFPYMKPVGIARQAKHLAELEALLAVVPEWQLISMILDMNKSKYTWQWVASFATIAEKLPLIRRKLETDSPSRQSYAARWQEENQRK